ncbi:uncharacterized protein TNCV_2141061 [Trichonephila clavipes]|uniref:Uncharacterized protein n=1 Tax=Trichonephila clavipes TaxID=2585209 RepID=A0A8X6VAT5_TRICX|nr:uncharacterized protein TNCV_2141061 [Trichonephila clavipes]
MSFTRKPGSGRPLQTSRRENRHISGDAHEETGLQSNGTRSSLATNPDSISVVMTIVFVCGDFLVNASILPFLYSGTPLPQLVVAAVAKWSRYWIVAGLVTSSSPLPLKTRRVGERCTLNLSRAQTSSCWCGVVVRRGGQFRYRPRHLTMVQNYVVRCQKPSCY